MTGVTVTQHSGVVIVRDAGYELVADAVTAFKKALSGPVVLVTGPVLFTTRDGIQSTTWSPSALSAWAAVSNPRGVPPVWATREDCAAALVDDSSEADPFAVADLWISALHGTRDGTLAVLSEPVAVFDLTRRTRWERVIGTPGYEIALRSFLERQRDLLQAELRQIIVSREVAAVQLTDVHAAAVRRRDVEAAEIARLEQDIARLRVELTELGRPELDWGTFARTSPIARDWGDSRGGPVDRHYIRSFIAAHSSDVRGRVLEVQEDLLTQAYGGPKVDASDVLDVNPSNNRATVVADLRSAREVPDSSYDCIILTQTAHVIDDVRAVLAECRRILAPGGVLLGTFPSVSRVCLEYGPDGDFWRLTAAGVRRLLSSFDELDVRAYGNVKTAVAFLHGLGERELSAEDYEVLDPYNPILIGARARKAGAIDRKPDLRGATPHTTRRNVTIPRFTRGVVLLYHRIESAPSDPFHLTVVPHLFMQHLNWLRTNGCVLPLERLLSLPVEELPHNAVALTFDDGYAHHLTTVAPLLTERHMPATFFLTTAGLDAEHTYWWEAVEHSEREPTIQMRERLTRASLSDRLAIGPPVNAPCPPHRKPLRREDVRRLAAMEGVRIGAHGVEHLFLPGQSIDVRLAEMRGSKAALERALGEDIQFFSYPYGAVDDVTADIARQEFRWSVVNDPAPLRASFDAARVPRLDVKSWSVEEFAAKVSTLWGYESRADPIRLLP